MASPPLLIRLGLVCRRSSSNAGKSWVVPSLRKSHPAVATPPLRVSRALLRPEVISELRLTDHGLHMIPCEPAIQVPFSDGLSALVVDRERARQEFSRISTRDAARFVEVDEQLKKL
jgi:hypothetical protein